jgi:uncharacterized protein YgbK (DUF1537 family)
MNASRRPLTDFLNSLPPEWPTDPLPAIAAALHGRREKVVVLDDDPTGTQTVHGVPVLTRWPVEALQAELANDLPVCFLLTNSRSLPLAAAQALNADIGHNLQQAAQLAGKDYAVVSRSDSTLRGHFPGEVQALADALGQPVDAWLLIPFFQEGGRYTIGDVHYVAEGDVLVPAGETESARDAVFGYRASNLRQWVEEKTGGRVAASAVAAVSLDDIRQGGPQRVTQRLSALPRGSVCVINAASRRDMEVFTQGLLAAEAGGKRFLYRTAASFVPVRAGIAPRPLLAPEEMVTGAAGGGLIIVGSYVPRTTSQLHHLLQQPGIAQVELSVPALLSDAQRAETIRQAVYSVDSHLQRGLDVVVFTSRELVTGADAASNLSIGQRVSDALVTLLQGLSTRPRYILAKGGITSSDVATRGLGVQRAMVLGQVLPGVPVWQLGPETRHAGLSYIVFPGNVGGPEAVGNVVLALRSSTKG